MGFREDLESSVQSSWFKGMIDGGKKDDAVK
jgi:hypothetical protein